MKLTKIFKRRRVANGDFKRRPRYRLSIVNLSSLRTIFELRVRIGGLVAVAIAAVLLIGVAWWLAFMYTPLRNALPTKMGAELRQDYLALSTRLDSANAGMALTGQYSRNILDLLQDSVRYVEHPDSAFAQPLPIDSLMEASDAERSFVRRFEEEERYNLSVLAPIAADGMTFYPPVSGVEVENRVSEAGVPSVQVLPARATPVSAIYRGTVVSTYFTTGKGITVVVQHPAEFVTVYSGLAETFVAKGEKVEAGSRIGVAQQNCGPLTIELWHNGTPLPPDQYVIF